ncbi:F-type H+-transporting ATPase subunit b [Brevundimonas alba]|uniref:ATP synthase subunit b n=1 Tax=Brevundimonas alba TaxID=74314 RepID=A0A7X5YHK2_9CAUL|nr:F0F1 ATP synthase subunit B [Brevundimonas alba]NJC40091.1 F-type H+-transporting ATPase subunit b [Brevundimonas alba]
MNMFFEEGFFRLDSAELWVLVGLVLFLAICLFTGAFKMVGGALDAKAAKIQSELDEAARLRAEAEALLAQIRAEKAEAEAQAAEMLKSAEADARVMEAEAKAKLEETLKRRQELAERRIAQAEAQASAEVKAAAADLAARAAEQILTARVAGQTSDPLLDAAIAQIGTRLN